MWCTHCTQHARSYIAIIATAPNRSKSARALYNQYKENNKKLKKDDWDLSNELLCADCGLGREQADSDLELCEDSGAAK